MKRRLHAFLITLTTFLCTFAQEGRPIVIQTPQPGARVFIDGKEVGRSPHTCILSIDSHWIYAIQGDLTSTIERINVKRGEGVLPSIMLTFHEYVDLALPSGTLWATCNVGGEKPEDYGAYYAWSETKPVTEETSENYEYKTKLHPKDDPAFVNWGSDWCLPTMEQLKELVNVRLNIVSYTCQNGVNGLLVTSRENGQTLFLPAAGYSLDGEVKDCNCVGNYWSKTEGNTYLNSAYQLYFMDSDTFTNSCDRFYGRSVRPVRMK